MTLTLDEIGLTPENKLNQMLISLSTAKILTAPIMKKMKIIREELARREQERNAWKSCE